VEIATEIDGLVLRPLEAPDLERYADLVARNRVHLTSHGDYQELAEATSDDLRSELREKAAARFGVWLADDLIGRVDLIPRDGADAVLGYWLDANRLGSGYATTACRELLRYGAERLGVTTAWAGVTHGNDRSAALLRRLGFEDVADMGGYERYRLDLTAGSRAASPGGADPDGVRPDFARLYGKKALVPGGSPIPEGAHGPIPLINGKGWQYRDGHGGRGLHESITDVRFNYPSSVHPDGYVMYGGYDVAYVGPEFDRSWAAIYRQDPPRFEQAVVERVERRLAEWPKVEHAATILVNDFPETSLEVVLNVPGTDRTFVYAADLWRAVDWYERFDPESLMIDRFVSEFDLMMESDVEQAGFTFVHDDRIHVDAQNVPSHVVKAIVDPSGPLPAPSAQEQDE